MVKKIVLVKPRGLCAGVERTLRILDLVVKKSKGPVYCRHQIVHNKKVVEEFVKRGVVFVEDLDQIPNGSVVVFSAHGSSPKFFTLAKNKNLTVIDGVCPLVVKVHLEAKKLNEAGYFIIYIGHKNHPEAIGVLGEIPAENGVLIETLVEAKALQISKDNIAVLTQTTLCLDETKEIIEYLKNRFRNLFLPPTSDICFSTQNRQKAVKELAKKVDVVLVIGSKTSSNSNRLRETAEKIGRPAYLLDGPEDLQNNWFENKEVIGITAGASVPDNLVQKVVDSIKNIYGGDIEELEVLKEDVRFPNVPKEVKQL